MDFRALPLSSGALEEIREVSLVFRIFWIRSEIDWNTICDDLPMLTDAVQKIVNRIK